MSAGPVPEGAPAGPVPARSLTLARLERELAAAVDVRADAYAAELRAKIARLSQGSAHNPGTEMTSARPRAATARRKR